MRRHIRAPACVNVAVARDRGAPSAEPKANFAIVALAQLTRIALLANNASGFNKHQPRSSRLRQARNDRRLPGDVRDDETAGSRAAMPRQPE